MPTLDESDEVLRVADEAYRDGRRWQARWLFLKWRPDPRYNHDKTPIRELRLHRVAEKGYVALMKDLLPKRKPIRNKLVRAVVSGEAPIPVLELFLARGWEINSHPKYSILSQVVGLEDEILLDWLLTHGADSNQKDSVTTPLVRAAGHGHFHLVKSFIKHGVNLKDTDALCWVTSNDDEITKPFEMMEYLLDAGVDVNYVQKAQPPLKAHINHFLGTALHHAVRSKDVRRLELLLAHGADWTLKNVQGRTPLELAKVRRHVESIRILAPLENSTLQDEQQMEEELERIRETWARKDWDINSQALVRNLQEERERAMAPLKQQMRQQEEAVGKLMSYDEPYEY